MEGDHAARPRRLPRACAACALRSQPAQPNLSPPTPSPISARKTDRCQTPCQSTGSSRPPQTAPQRVPANPPSKVASSPSLLTRPFESELKRFGNPDAVRRPHALAPATSEGWRLRGAPAPGPGPSCSAAVALKDAALEGV